MNSDKGLIRLNKFISNSGLTARRKADELIFQGRVSVNMKTVTDPSLRIDQEKDIVKVDGEIVKPQSEFIYIVLYKPRGYVTTTRDEKGRPTVMDLIGLNMRLYPVGRLDYDTDGVLLLTNDGEFANMMMHPSHRIFKTYFARLDKQIDEKDIKKLKAGIILDGKQTARAKVRIAQDSSKMCVWISIHEGRNRQVKRMLETIGYRVVKLKRVEYARIGLDGLNPGQWRYLAPHELELAKKLAYPKQPSRKNKNRIREVKGGKKKKKKKLLETHTELDFTEIKSSDQSVIEDIFRELKEISDKISGDDRSEIKLDEIK